MRLAVIAKIVNGSRSRFADLLAVLFLTVNNTHGVAFKPALAGIAHGVYVLLEIVVKSLVVFLAAFGTAYAVDAQGKLSDTEMLEQRHCKKYYFSICLI